MSNLTKNTQQLEALLAKVNALPEAGSGGTDTSDATAAAGEIFAGETAYTADGKVTGTFTIENELTEQTDLISQITNLVATKATPSGTDTNDATATASDILSGKTAYAKGEKVTGTIATKTSSNLTASGATVTVPAGYYATQATKSVATATQATPSVSISSSGLITASATQSAGYVSAGTKSGTKQLTTKGTTTYTPGTSNQTIASSTYLTGTQTIKGDANLKAENIASGVSIFGVTGTHAGSTAEDLDAELTTQESLISELSSILDSKASGGSGGSVETCSGKIIANPMGGPLGGYSYRLTYTDGTLNVTTEQTSDPVVEHEFTAAKNTIVYISGGVCEATSGCAVLGGGYGNYAYLITDNNFVLTAPI